MTDQYLQALILIGGSAGGLDNEIRSAIDAGKPIGLPLLKEALAIESRSVGSRAGVRNRLAHEIRRQEMKAVVTA